MEGGKNARIVRSLSVEGRVIESWVVARHMHVGIFHTDRCTAGGSSTHSRTNMGT